jgi:hypothetical protein
MSTNAYLGKRVLEEQALTEQVQQGGSAVRWEPTFSFPTLSLGRCTSGPAISAVAPCADSRKCAMCCRDSAATGRGIGTIPNG